MDDGKNLGVKVLDQLSHYSQEKERLEKIYDNNTILGRRHIMFKMVGITNLGFEIPSNVIEEVSTNLHSCCYIFLFIVLFC